MTLQLLLCAGLLIMGAGLLYVARAVRGIGARVSALEEKMTFEEIGTPPAKAEQKDDSRFEVLA